MEVKGRSVHFCCFADLTVFAGDGPIPAGVSRYSCDDGTVFSGMADGVEFMKTLDITEEQRELVMSGNAIRLFNLPV